MYIHPLPVFLGETFEIPLPSRGSDGAAITAGTWADADFSFYKDGSTTAATIDASAITPSSDFDADAGKSQLQVLTANDADFTEGSRWQVWAEKTIDTLAVVECIAVFRMETIAEKAARLFREDLMGMGSEITETMNNTVTSVNLTDIVHANSTLVQGEILAWTNAGNELRFMRVTGFAYPQATVEMLDGTDLPEAVASGDRLVRVGQHTATVNGSKGIAEQTTLGSIGDNTSAMLANLGTPTDLGSGATVSDNLVDIEGIVDDLAEGGRLDLLIDAIKAKTDQFTFTKANEVDANAVSMNDETILGTGTSGDKWRGA